MPDTRPPAFVTDFRDPAGCYDRVAEALGRGATSPDHPLHWFGVATAGPAGADVRVVVLRGFDPDARTVAFHADARSPKVGQLRADPRAALLFYDHAARLQLRLTAACALHHEDATAAAVWGTSSDETRRAYAAAHGPGQPLDPDADPAYPPPPMLDDDDAFARFVLVVCRFDALDVLELRAAGLRRVRLTWPAGQLRMDRVAP